MSKPMRAVGCALVGILVVFASIGLFGQTITGPGQLERCEEGTFTLTFANPSPTQTACQIIFRNTPPSSEYEFVPGSGLLTLHTGASYVADPVLETWDVDSIVSGAYELPPGETATVEFRLLTTCLAVSGTDAVQIDYVDCTAPGTPLDVTDSLSIEILPGAITVVKTPANPPGGVGDLVTWTLEVRSTGLGGIRNVVATDTLGAGLEYVSSSPSGDLTGQVVTWDLTHVPEFSYMAPDTSVSIELTARVVACSGLGNTFDARFGCDDGQVCADTAAGFGECGCTATSSVAFIKRLPFLSFPAPTITIPYCATTTTVTIPITNSGDGRALDGLLCVDLGALLVSNVQGGATYDGTCFHLPDIDAGSVFSLEFDITYGADWCTSAPGGTPLYTLEYTNECGVVHEATPRFGSIGATAAPRLSVSKTGPSVVQFGSSVVYEITATYSGPTSCGVGGTSSAIVIDLVPDGFPVLNAGTGLWTPGADGLTGGTITWTFDPNVTPSFSDTVTVQVPYDCGFCYTERTNTVTATATSCCGCALSASSSSTVAITCERLYMSTLSVSPSSTLERCGDPVTFTDENVFADDEGLDGITFSDFVYAFIKANGLVYVPGSAVALVDGAPVPVSVVDGANEVQLTAQDAGSVRGHTLTFVYDIQATTASTPACGGSSPFYVWASHEIPTIGPCAEFYDTQLLTVEAPAMSAGISGVPTIQEDCATYPVTITFRRTSSTADPYDARLVLTGTAGVIADFAGATWTGVSPVEPPTVLPDSIEWRFADGFTAAGAQASLTVPVTTRCGGPRIGLAAQGTFDDLCHDIDGYNDTCSTSASASSTLRLTGNVYLTMTPETIYTRGRTVTWTIELYNSSNGTAYNVYVDDVLGSGLVYVSSTASGYSGGLVTQPGQDHNGFPINGASFLFERIAPGERPTITLTADLVACADMTNAATVGWGCGGAACQPERTDSAVVLVAPAGVVSTSFSPTPIDVCANSQATITLRSTGLATAYDLVASVTLPAGLVYAGNPQYRVSGGGWLAAGEPAGSPGPTLTWDATQVAALAAVAPGVTIDIRFDIDAGCAFSGGVLQAQTSYENPCGQTFVSGVGTFSIGVRTPTVSLTVSQTSPAAGQAVPCGGDVTWEIRVTNSGPANAEAVWVEATLGAGLTYSSSTGGSDGGWGSGQTVTWEIVGLAAGATSVLTVTAESASGPGGCSDLTNSVRAYWACGPDGSSATTPDCLSSSAASGSAAAIRTVNVTAAVSLSPSSIGACETEKTLTLTLTNQSSTAPAHSPDARITLPAGLTYRPGSSEVNCGGGFAAAGDPAQVGQTLTWYDISATGPGNDLCTTIPAGGSVAVRFDVDAACYRTTATAPVTVYYYDCCESTQYSVSSSPSLTASSPTMSVTMTPASTALDCADVGSTVTWTITVTNTGGATADVVRIIDTLGADLVRVSGGTQIGANPLQWGWEFGPLAPGASQSVQLTARLAAPPNNCTATRRRSTAVTSWGCAQAALDGDPNTTAEYSCTSDGSPVTTTANVTIPDLSISASDISPQFTCASDGISDGVVLLTVRNAGTAAITRDFSITYSESTTGWGTTATYTSLGGTLPLAAGGNRVLTLSGWPIACTSCSYQFAVALDTGGVLCECREDNNAATLSYTPTAPDLVVASTSLAASCASDGQTRIQGTVTLRNQGCGASPLTTNIPMRFTVYAGDLCGGAVLDQWTQTFTGVSLAAGGGTQAFAVNRTAVYDACSLCDVSVLVEADYSNAICECDGDDNNACVESVDVSTPDLIVGAIAFDGLACTGDAVSGFVSVTVTNQGCGAAGAFNVGLATSGCLTFSSQRVTSLAAGASVVVQFPVASAWSGCATCNCTFTATVDTGSEVCECSGANNVASAVYTSPLPDLVITAFTASAPNPCLPGSAQVTVRNAGCGVAPAGVLVAVTGAVTGQASTTLDLAAGESQTIAVPFTAPVGCGAGYAVTATVDPLNAVCECTGANNAASTTFSVIAPDLWIADLLTSCNVDGTFTLTATLLNGGAVGATGVSVRVYADGTLVHAETRDLDASSAIPWSVVSPPLSCGEPHAFRVVLDEENAVCECDETNNEAADAAALCACPALVTEKAITSVWRRGTNLGVVGTVESGDVICYEATLTNTGPNTAYRVDLTDELPVGLVYHAAAPGHDGQYVLSTGGSGSFPVPVGGTTFSTDLDATLPNGHSLVIRYCALALSSLDQGQILTNVVRGEGEEGNGDPIPAGDASTTVVAHRPGLSVDKVITDVLRSGASRGPGGPVEPGDIVLYQTVIRNVGLGTAYEVGFSDTLPVGLVVHTSPPGHAGTYSVTAPAASGSLGLSDGAAQVAASIGATIAGGGRLTATYAARVTSDAVQGVPLINVATATGEDALGAPIPEQNAAVGDTSDDDAEDPDADDTGIASIDVREPALSVDKTVEDVRRGGVAIGVVDPVLYGDVIVYRVAVRNVGLGTAYGVDVTETLPIGFEIDLSTPAGAGTYAVDSPASSGSLGLADGVSAFTTSTNAVIAGQGVLTLRYAARVTPAALPSVPSINVASASGLDGSGAAIPPANPELGDTSDDDQEDPDADDTGVASVRVGAPALVTEKRIDRVVRRGQPSTAGTVEPGDIVTYTLVVRNVGHGPALNVSLVDELPNEFAYRGPTAAAWPGGSSTAGPAGAPGPTLTWPLGARLNAGEALVLSFDASVLSSVRQGRTYTNAFTAAGEDAAGAAIPPDSRALVPADTDPDDSSAIGIPAVEPALVTRKQVADVLRDGVSLGPIGTVKTGDVVAFELVVSNVGLGTAYDVDVRDDLPTAFSYVPGSTSASGPFGGSSFTTDPLGVGTGSLWWTTSAQLAPGNAITLRFKARADGSIVPSRVYLNILSADGLDGADGAIPPNQSADIRQDTDPDDQDSALLVGIGDVPALVTSKSIATVLRDGRPVYDGRVEVGDIVRYELSVDNVGPATAFAVDIVDRLPDEFEYIPGSTAALTPQRASSADPSLFVGELLFDLDATLTSGQGLTLRFDALVVGPVIDGRWYVNRMQASGFDDTGTPIPANQGSIVPSDTDPDDASTESILGRSSVTEGEGGFVNVPVLRKSAETLGAGACRGTAALPGSVWFQTDIALFAAAEFASFAASVQEGDRFAETLLPTWSRTAAGELADAARDNLLQVNVLSTVGVPLERGARILAAASNRAVSPEQVVAERLDELADVAGLSASDVRPEGRWIAVEYAGGEPIFTSKRDTPWGESGTWTLVDERIVASSLGMGLVRQAQEAATLVRSEHADDRYTGWVLAEVMANKLVALGGDLLARPSDGREYVPHGARARAESSGYDVTDGASVLFDQVSLLWGATRARSFVVDSMSVWPADELDLADVLHAEAQATLERAARAIEAYHVDSPGQFVGRFSIVAGEEPAAASTVDIALLVVAADEALRSGAQPADVLTRLRDRAAAQLADRQRNDGLFAEPSSTAGVFTHLAAQFAGIYGSLAAGDVAAARRAFDALEAAAWVGSLGFGLYRLPDDPTPCYTALDVGLAVAALRELAAQSQPQERGLVLARLAAFVRSVLDDAALQLDNADIDSTTKAVPQDGRGTLFGLTVEDGVALAPVLQRWLCFADLESETGCGGLRILKDAPWYQTDIAMYASTTLRAVGVGRDDDADANLAAVVLHSQLGLGFDAVDGFGELPARFAADLGSIAQIDPILVPFYAGDPYLGEGDATSLAWNPASFDARIVPSAIGMTLLRESQEVAEILRASHRSLEDDLTARVLLASVVGKVAVLEALVTEGPNGSRTIPHAFAVRTADGRTLFEVVDRTSALFDQASLLLGLAEAYRLVSDSATASLLALLPVRAADLPDRVTALVRIVLATLESAHRRPVERVLADAATPQASRWMPGDEVTTVSLGLAAEALERIAALPGWTDEFGPRARQLLGESAAFLRSTLWDGSGTYRETWTAANPASAVPCVPPTQSGQLGALRVLLAEDGVAGGATNELRAGIIAFDDRFWKRDLEMYAGTADRWSWCMTPLDLALAVGVLSQADRFVDENTSTRIASHLARHVNRVLDAIDLQIPARSANGEGRLVSFAPVFDRRVCVEPAAPLGDARWTRAGDLIRYTVEAENPTSETFANTRLVDLLPEGVAFVAAEPAPASVDGRTLVWNVGELAAGAARIWTIDARVDATRPLGETLTNCATLTFTDAQGRALPSREACADVTLSTADDVLGSALRTSSVDYKTDEAMRLAVALDDLVARGGLGDAADEASAASLANLGVLLGESGLGTPLGATTWNEADEALAAGLPRAPFLGAPIVLPTSGGVPVIDRGTGFVARRLDITPAALGWTLAREVEFLETGGRSGEGLSAYLQRLVEAVVHEQVRWIAEAITRASDGSSALAHGTYVTVEGNVFSTSVRDHRVLTYDQASLLIGLARAARSPDVPAEARRSAEDAAGRLLIALRRHVADDGTVFDDATSGSSARWTESAVLVRALAEGAAAVPRYAEQTWGAVSAIARRALIVPERDPAEEAARIDVLLVAGRVLGDRDLQQAGLAAWRSFADVSRDASGRLVFSALARAGWRYTPAEAARAFEVLGEVIAAAADLAPSIADLAGDLFRADVLEVGVQWRSVLGYWRDHVGVPCLAEAPAFVRYPGP